MSLSDVFELIKSVVTDGGPGFAQIALTNECNADCGFCGFARSCGRPGVHVPEDRLGRAIDILHEKGIRYIVLVGGEPLLYRGLDRAISAVRDKGMTPVICTNGWLLTDGRIERLRDAGLTDIIMSIDAPDDSAHDANRGLPGLAARIRRANPTIARLGMHATASVTVSRLLGDMDALPGYLEEMGFADVTFSYPLRELHSTYLSFSDSDLVGFTDDELVGMFGKLKDMKKKFRVLNPSAGMDEMVRFVRGEPAVFPCLAGYKYFFLDWNLDVYRCHHLGKPICAVEEFADAEPIRDGCAHCMIDCYRDPSVLQFSAVSISDSIKELRSGRPVRALMRIMDPRNLRSIMAVVEQMSLVNRYREK